MNGFSEVLYQVVYFLFAQGTHKSGRVEVKAAGSTHGHLSARIGMGHIAAMTNLNGGFCALGVNGVGQFFEVGDDFLGHPELSVKGITAFINGSISYGGHSDATFGNGGMIVE